MVIPLLPDFLHHRLVLEFCVVFGANIGLLFDTGKGRGGIFILKRKRFSIMAAGTITVNFPSGVSTYIMEAAEYDGMTIFFSGTPFYQVDDCKVDYAVVYLNAYGGWDTFGFPVGKKVEDFTQFDYNTSYDNTTIGFGKRRQISEITPRWELTSGWLTEEQAAKFAKHLISSAQVYLQDIAAGKWYPVVITDKSAEYKTNRYNNALINYTLNVQASQDRIRR